MPLEHFGEFILLLMSDEKAKALEKALKADGHLKGTKLQEFLKKYGTEVAKGGANAAGRTGFFSLLDKLGDFTLSGDGVPDIGQMIDGLG